MLMTKVYPVPGRIARHPGTGEIVPPEGMDVPRGGYWLRRILDGDVTETHPAKPARAKESPAEFSGVDGKKE